MQIIRKKGWEIRESQATPEALFLNRRAVLGGLVGAGLGAGWSGSALAQSAAPPADALFPYPNNPAFTIERPLTSETIAASYNNFYEFGLTKAVVKAAESLQTRPWMVSIGGMVEKPFEIGIDDLIASMPREERLYRFRCVEGWSMTVPWSGFALRALVEKAKPLSSAQYLVMETFNDPKMAPLQRQPFYPWPYVEGVTMAEAMNDLAFMVTGAYGKPVPKQMGAPLRLALPWKYGFKSVKSIRKITFTDKRPKTFWEGLQPAEYGFWANVNPAVAHPRWSQATEEVLGTGSRIPTQIFNGYGAYVADLYKGLEKERLWA